MSRTPAADPVPPVEAAPPMPGVSALLDAWDAGRNAAPVRRALLLLSLDGTGDAAARRLTIGRQNERLLRLRARTFGDRLDCLVDCPSCGDALELGVSTGELLAGTDPPAFTTDALAGLRVETPRGAIRFHPPTVADVLAVLTAGAAAPAALLERCIEDAAATELDSEVAEEIGARMAAADPLAQVDLALTCPACGHTWTAPLDVAAFVWTELDAWARATLWHVHRLASAYGWSESQVLALSPARRDAYLEMLEA